MMYLQPAQKTRVVIEPKHTSSPTLWDQLCGRNGSVIMDGVLQWTNRIAIDYYKLTESRLLQADTF
jgi:hypothetical protein